MPETFDDVKDHIVLQGGRKFLKATNGELLEMFGYGEGPPLELDPRIDVCLPIYEQAQRLIQEDARHQRTGTGEAA